MQSQFNPIGCRGKLMQWTLDDGRVLRTDADFIAAMSEMDDSEFDILRQVQELMHEMCTCTAWHPGDSPATFVVVFDNGQTLAAVWATDVWFD